MISQSEAIKKYLGDNSVLFLLPDIVIYWVLSSFEDFKVILCYICYIQLCYVMLYTLMSELENIMSENIVL